MCVCVSWIYTQWKQSIIYTICTRSITHSIFSSSWWQIKWNEWHKPYTEMQNDWIECVTHEDKTASINIFAIISITLSFYRFQSVVNRTIASVTNDWWLINDFNKAHAIHALCISYRSKMNNNVWFSLCIVNVPMTMDKYHMLNLLSWFSLPLT